jgi:hypothetical protein
MAHVAQSAGRDFFGKFTKKRHWINFQGGSDFEELDNVHAALPAFDQGYKGLISIEASSHVRLT